MLAARPAIELLETETATGRNSTAHFWFTTIGGQLFRVLTFLWVFSDFDGAQATLILDHRAPTRDMTLRRRATPGPGGLFGIRTSSRSLDIEKYLTAYPEWRENGWLPVAGDGNGNYYVLAAGHDDGRSPVLFIDTHDDPAEVAYIAASDLWHFLRFLLRKECGEHGWPFDRDKVVADDPAITSFDDIPQPWDA